MSAPHAPLGHLSHLGFALAAASTAEEVIDALLTDLVALPDVSRVGIALSEGGGRRLRFTSGSRGRQLGEPVSWCHIDAYDEVPLTTVVRTGTSVTGPVESLTSRYRGFASYLQEIGVQAIAALPLAGKDTAMGGLIVYFDQPQELGERQVRLLEASARRTGQALLRIRTHHAGRLLDSVSVLDPTEARKLAVTELDDDTRAPREARRFLRRTLADWPVDAELGDAAELGVSELVTNAVLHAQTGSRLTLLLEDGMLRISVHDLGGPGDQVVRADSATGEVHGRGLMLVEAISSSWGADRDAIGTNVWFELAVTPDAETSAVG